ncbi:MAG: outer membrane beta-barrel protein, partial [Candidatus Hodarchaeota archaeon]
WSLSAKEASGYVTQISDTEFVGRFAGVAVGSSGGPVLSGNRIAGMAINDDGKQIYAIPIKLIRKKVAEWLKLNVLKFSDLPFFSVGVCGNLSIYKVPIVVVENVQGNYSLNYGAFFEASFSPLFSFQTELEYGHIRSKTNPEYAPDYRFRNNYSSVSVSLLYHPITNLRGRDVVYFKVGYSYAKINPKINIEQSGWVDLKSLGSSIHNYSNNVSSFNIGFGAGPSLSENINLRIEFIYKNFTSKYLYIDVLEPYNANKKNDWLLTFGIKLDYVFRLKSSKIMFLR